MVKPDTAKVPAGKADEVGERGALPQGEPDLIAAFGYGEFAGPAPGPAAR